MARGDREAGNSIVAGLLAWLAPGVGHWYLGLRGFAVVYFAAITFPYAVGLALGGVKTQIDPANNGWLFLAEMGIGSYTLAGYGLSRATANDPAYISAYPGSEVAQIYLAVAGLLNVLAIFDAIARAQTGGLPVFNHERVAAEMKQAAQQTSQTTSPAGGTSAETGRPA